jgi:hypothetical protein
MFGVYTFLIIVICSVIYTVISRTIDDFITYPTYIASIIALAFLANYFSEWIKSGLRHPPRYEIKGNLYIVPLIPALSIAYYCLGATVKDVYLNIHVSHSVKSSLIISLCTLGLSIALFSFRLSHRWLYGLSEIIVGVVIVNYRLSGDDSTISGHNADFYLAILTAGIYLIVRGLDNMHVAFNASMSPTIKQ